MASPGKDEEMKQDFVNDDDYTSAFFDDNQLMALRGTNSNEDDAMMSQHTISNFMAKGNYSQGNNS
jgi:hypothetical protein